jgi:hypothetical protein
MTYRPYEGLTVKDELKWYFFFLNKGYSKREAREHAMYYLVPQILVKETEWEPEVEAEEVENDDLEDLDLYEEDA